MILSGAQEQRRFVHRPDESSGSPAASEFIMTKNEGFVNRGLSCPTRVVKSAPHSHNMFNFNNLRNNAFCQNNLIDTIYILFDFFSRFYANKPIDSIKKVISAEGAKNDKTQGNEQG
jgi:hypothetical protein